MDDALDDRFQDLIEGDIADQCRVQFVEERCPALLALGDLSARADPRHQLTRDDGDGEVGE